MTVKTETGIEKAKNPIKIHHLFEMTAGLNYNLQTPALMNYYAACDWSCPTVEMVAEIAKTPLEFEPGEGWCYSLCHDVLAALVEVLSGQKFGAGVNMVFFLTGHRNLLIRVGIAAHMPQNTGAILVNDQV